MFLTRGSRQVRGFMCNQTVVQSLTFVQP